MHKQSGSSTVFAVDLLDRLRYDQELSRTIHTIEASAEHWKRGLRPTLDSIQKHEEAIQQALRHLAEHHLATLFGDSTEPTVLLLNYQSGLSLEADFRVFSPLIAATSGITPSQPAQLLSHVSGVLLPRLSSFQKSPERFQFHTIAQKRFETGNHAPRRVPIYVGSTPHRPRWIESLKCAHPPTLFCHLDGRAAAILYHVPHGADRFDVRKFARDLLQAQRPASYPNERTVFDDYDAYLCDLLGWAKGLWLCTCAVSDELTDLPLGTIMVYSPCPPDLAVVARLRELSFEVMNAIHRIERMARGFLDTSCVLARWITHETAFWFRTLRDQAQELSPVCKAPTVMGDADISTRIERVKTRLLDLDAYGCGVVELLNHFSGTETAPVSIAEFERRVVAFGRLKGITPVFDLRVESTVCLPREMITVVLELVRNAADKMAQTNSEREICISIRRDLEQMIMTVASRPHPLGCRSALVACNHDARDYYVGQLDGYFKSMNTGEQLGHWLVIRLAAQIGATQPVWEYTIGRDGLLTVEVVVPWRS